MTKLSISDVVNTVREFLKCNEGDEATNSLIISMGARILKITPEEMNELVRKKRIYKIPVYWTMKSVLEIEADSLKEAIEIARNDEGPLPIDGDFLDGSWDVEDDIGSLCDLYGNERD